MTLEFDINETGTFDVVYNASISIPNTTVTVSASIVTLYSGSTLTYTSIQ